MKIDQELMATESVNQAIDRSGDTFDPGLYFEQWWDEVQGGLVERDQQETVGDDSSSMSIESLPGSNCEVTFEGVLHFDGHSMGNIRSSGGRVDCHQKRPR